MQKTIKTLLDEHLQSVQDIKEVGTDDFFYARLKARMEKSNLENNWYFPVKPALLTSMLTLLLAMNTLILLRNAGTKSIAKKEGIEVSIQEFAKAYDLTNSSSF